MEKTVYTKTLARPLSHWLDTLSVKRTHAKMQDFYARRGHPMAIFANDLIGVQINQYGRYEADELDLLFSFLKPVFGQFSPTIALDIGANIGNHTLFFAEHFSKVLAFEPNPRTYTLLKFNTSFRPNIKTFSYGLGEKKGTFELVENVTNMGNSSILTSQPTNQQSVKVQVKVLDEILSESGQIDFIKIDVEGFEASVLKGATKTLQTHQPIIALEQHEAEFIGNSTPAIDVLKTLGYTFCWHHAERPLRSYLARRLRNLHALVFGKKVEIVTGNQVPRQFHSMLIAIPPRFQEGLISLH